MKGSELNERLRLGNLHIAYGAVIDDLTRKFQKNPPPKDAVLIHMLAKDVLRVLRKERDNVALEAQKKPSRKSIKEMDRLIADLDPKAVDKLPLGFSLWLEKMQLMWLKQHQRKK